MNLRVPPPAAARPSSARSSPRARRLDRLASADGAATAALQIPRSHRRTRSGGGSGGVPPDLARARSVGAAPAPRRAHRQTMSGYLPSVAPRSPRSQQENRGNARAPVPPPAADKDDGEKNGNNANAADDDDDEDECEASRRAKVRRRARANSTLLPELSAASGPELLRWEATLTKAARAVFDAKCADLGKQSTDAARARMASSIVLQCQEGTFAVPDLGLTAGACREACAYVAANNASEPSKRFSALVLAGNPVGDAGAAHVAAILHDGGAAGLSRVDLESTGAGTAGFRALFEALPDAPALADLSLSAAPSRGKMHPSRGGCEAVGQFLASPGRSALRKLGLRGCGIGLSRHAVKALADGLRSPGAPRSLAWLDLGRNRLDHESVRALLSALGDAAGCGPRLEHLSLRGNPAGSHAAVEISAFLAGPASASALASLDLGKLGLGVAALALLTNGLGSNRALRRLVLDGNPMGGMPGHAELLAEARRGPTKGGRAAAASLVQHGGAGLIDDGGGDAPLTPEQELEGFEEVLRTFDLETEYVSPALRMNGSLTSLSMVRCGLGNSVVAALVDALRGHASLSELALARNAITCEGAAAVAEAAPTFGALAALELGFNRVGEEGGAALAWAAKECPRLARLGLEHNELGAKSAAGLLAAVTGGTHLQDVACAHNLIPHKAVLNIRSAAAANAARARAAAKQRARAEVEHLRGERKRLHETEQTTEEMREEERRCDERLRELADELAAARDEAHQVVVDDFVRLREARAEHVHANARLLEACNDVARAHKAGQERVAATKQRAEAARADEARKVEETAETRELLAQLRQDEALGLDELSRTQAMLRLQARKAAATRDEAADEAARLGRLLAVLRREETLGKQRRFIDELMDEVDRPERFKL